MNQKRKDARGHQTREALITAAMTVFGRDGFDAASTRAIAQAAGVNQALIGYHFGGKQGLYLAVFEFIAQHMADHMLPVAGNLVQGLDGVDETTAQRQEIGLQGMETLVSALLDMFGEEAAAAWVRLVFREQQDPTPAFDILYDRVMSRLLQLLDRLIGLALGQDPDAENTRLRALMVVGQVLVFVIARTTSARHMGWQQLDPTHLPAIKKQLVANLRAQFGGGPLP